MSELTGQKSRASAAVSVVSVKTPSWYFLASFYFVPFKNRVWKGMVCTLVSWEFRGSLVYSETLPNSKNRHVRIIITNRPR